MRWLILLILLAAPVSAATLSGTAYTQDLQVAKYALFSINTTPQQRLLMANGTYQVSVPPGAYELKATINIEGKNYEDSLVVQVRDTGSYTYDFILFQVQNSTAETLPPLDQDLVFDQATTTSIGWIPAALLLVILILLVVFLSRRRWWKSASEPIMAADLQGVLKAIKDEGGRTTQRELRKHIPCSEAKLSLMLTELEAKGKIQKIKKGRGNLIVLK
jgi:uncharacterized membrane protein